MSTPRPTRRPWPSQCLICRAWPAQPVCRACAARFAPPGTRCESCALPVPAGVARCGACLREPPPLDLCLAAVPYQWPWTGCIARLKFHQDAGLAAPLADLLTRAPGVADALALADLVLPMPLSPERLAERGYNPSVLLARRLAPARCRIDLLVRTRHTPPQRGLARADRLRNVRGAFSVDPLRAHELHERRVALVDDVMTTGASLHEAARALRDAGARHVVALAFARTDEPAAGRS
ncbi:ComF family protein [Ottowia sp.]|jgi:ComF family protein|uniref:ComF family protein n=1 Tax=Ottowia sp. TaxID=1898956 RepID=UPI0025EEE71E|nr:ComF family protein [Ottowia sp.]MBK6615633.1 ComF family protein [Ottowia sp.]MBK6746701.1 ComF family protein [Ottowia sp.]